MWFRHKDTTTYGSRSVQFYNASTGLSAAVVDYPTGSTPPPGGVGAYFNMGAVQLGPYGTVEEALSKADEILHPYYTELP
jgi:hypothetical protein